MFQADLHRLGSAEPCSSRPLRLVIIATTGIEEYQAQLLAGINPVLDAHGLDRIVYMNTATTVDLPADFVALLTNAEPVGLIGTNLTDESHGHKLTQLIHALRLPTVMIGAGVPGIPSVRGDNFAGMRALMGHLLDECGVRRPVFVRGIAHHPDSIDRETVFREELAIRGLTVDEELVIEGQFWHDHAHRSMRQLLRRRRDMDAVVAANDISARGCVSALHDARIRVPEDVLVTGFDNERNALTWPRLTTVEQNLSAQGKNAAELLIAQLAGEPVPSLVTTPSRLVIRESTANTPPSLSDQVEVMTQALEATKWRTSRSDAAANLARDLLVSHTLEDLVRAFASCLPWLELDRCFLVVRADLCGSPRDMPADFFREPGEEAGAGKSSDSLSFPVQLLLDYRDGVLQDPPADPFPAHRILPDSLRAEIAENVLVVAPMVIGRREYGFLIFERNDAAVSVVETVHLDLSRALDGVLNRRTLEAHLEFLEETVTQRTVALSEEVATRRRAETDLRNANAELLRMAMLDGLTGIANRTAFERHMTEKWNALAATGGEIAVLMVDVDLFKNYNDHFGHLAGDETLRDVAQCLARAACRPGDLAARYGGEEFVVVLPGQGAHGASTVALRFQAMLAERAIPHPASPVADFVTASIGIALTRVSPECTAADLVATADRALYRAKDLGRNRAVLIDSGCVHSEAMP